jgi:hypothetical protein
MGSSVEQAITERRRERAAALDMAFVAMGVIWSAFRHCVYILRVISRFRACTFETTRVQWICQKARAVLCVTDNIFMPCREHRIVGSNRSDVEFVIQGYLSEMQPPETRRLFRHCTRPRYPACVSISLRLFLPSSGPCRISHTLATASSHKMPDAGACG